MTNHEPKKEIKATETIEPKNSTEEGKKVFDLNDFNQIIDLVKNNNEEVIKNSLITHIKNIIASQSDKYRFVFLYRTIGFIDDSDADNIYNSILTQDKKDIFLVLNSTGGRIEPAYLISKCCKENKGKKFIVTIPRYAKSAATLIALGADEIHMGQLSQIGPIDPQMYGLPALGLRSALECIAKLCEKYPTSSDMFAQYLAKTLSLNMLGYFERIPESAKDYAIRLLQNKNTILEKTKISEIAEKLVYEYKDHSFVIDKDESKELLGDDIVKIETQEYVLGNNIYKLMETVNLVYRVLKNRVFNLIGSVEDLQGIDVPIKT